MDTSGFFGARPVLLWPNNSPNAVLTLPFQVAVEGRYALRLTAANGPGYGTYDIEIDGKKASSADFRAQEPSEADLPLGTHLLSKGRHTISFRAGPEGSDRIGPLAAEVLRVASAAARGNARCATDNEAHFIRLGIGRAVYAYRLAYGTLPDSLQTLVKADIMPAPLLEGRELSALAVAAGGTLGGRKPPSAGWKHRWQGLDARR